MIAVAALSPERTERLALIGTGRIAFAFAQHLPSVLPGVSIVLGSRDPDRARKAATEWGALLEASIEPAESIAGAMRSSEVVVTLSDANETLFSAEAIEPGTLICAMGGQKEFDRDVFDRADRWVGSF